MRFSPTALRPSTEFFLPDRKKNKRAKIIHQAYLSHFSKSVSPSAVWMGNPVDFWAKVVSISISIKKITLVLLACVLLAACGGGGGSSTDPDMDNPTTPEVPDPADPEDPDPTDPEDPDPTDPEEPDPCESDSCEPDPRDDNYIHELSQIEKQALLDAHNDYRSKCASGEGSGINGPEFASDMIKVFWDPALEEMAKQRALSCYNGHYGGPQGIRNAYDSVRHLTSYESEGLARGKYATENIALFTHNPPASNYNISTWESAVFDWYHENTSYDWETNACYGEHCGHWAQVCNNETRYIGCAIANCNTGIAGTGNSSYDDGAIQVVCTYWPERDVSKKPFNEDPYGSCARCRAGFDTDQCHENLCVGGKSTTFVSSEGINDEPDQCHDGLGRYEKLCNESDDITPPSDVTGISYEILNGAIHLRWEKSQDDYGISRYIIYRQSIDLTGYLGPTSKTEFVDENTPEGISEIDYYIKAVDLAENSSEYSVIKVYLD
ncbi:CAP domain-containing protein [Microbulbifer sp. EKSA005]|uniref:CAP domain-containing protein n=1 Tax=Microbulbifer sp. EKSA005 TaxID=3243364 RepID=UPI00404192BC